MSAFHPVATEQRTQFYVGFVPEADIGALWKQYSTVGHPTLHKPREFCHDLFVSVWLTAFDLAATCPAVRQHAS